MKQPTPPMSGGASFAGLGGLDDDGVVVVSATGGGGDPVTWRYSLDRAAAHLAPLSSVRVPIGEARAAMLTARRLENDLRRFRQSCDAITADPDPMAKVLGEGRWVPWCAEHAASKDRPEDRWCGGGHGTQRDAMPCRWHPQGAFIPDVEGGAK